MSPQEAYSYLFTDSFVANLILPIHHGYVYEVMKIFNSYDMQIATFLAVSASVIAMMLNFGFGRMLTSLSKDRYNKQLQNSKNKYYNLISNNGHYIAIVSFLPVIGAVIVTLLGFFRLPFIKTMIWALLGIIGYYSYVIMLGLI